MTQRCLVTGSSGFVGTHLIRRLAGQGHAVVGVDGVEPRERLAGVEYCTGDVRDLHAFDPGRPIDRIYNLAAIHRTPGHEPREYYETNVVGAIETTALAERLGVAEIVYFSSISVYGPGEDMKTESSAPSPTSPYGRSKLIAERVHRAWFERDATRRLVIARPAVIFGAGENGNFTRLAALLRKGIFVYPGRKDTIKACIYIDDLLDALDFVCARPERHVLFNAAYPQRYTLEQLVDTLIAQHFPRVRTFLFPKAAVMAAAKMLAPFDGLNIGIHPERVQKLVRSTDIYPQWLTDQGFQFPSSLEEVFGRWRDGTHGTFR